MSKKNQQIRRNWVINQIAEILATYTDLSEADAFDFAQKHEPELMSAIADTLIEFHKIETETSERMESEKCEECGKKIDPDEGSLCEDCAEDQDVLCNGCEDEYLTAEEYDTNDGLCSECRYAKTEAKQ